MVFISTKHFRVPGKGISKLQEKFYGPCKVLQVVSPLAYKLELPHALRFRHPVFPLALLRRADPATGQPRLQDPEEGEEESSVPVFLPPVPKKRGRKSKITSNDTDSQNSEDNIYEMGRILDRRWENGTLQHLVTWEGYDDVEATWEPRSSFIGEDCIRMRTEYEDKYQRDKIAQQLQNRKQFSKKRLTNPSIPQPPRYSLRGGLRYLATDEVVPEENQLRSVRT
eukprot:Rmarinus@m.1574